MIDILVFIFAYLIGSISGSIIVSHSFFNEDIRTKGSGNAGSTNTYRAYGAKYAIIALAIDYFKGVLVPLIVAKLTPLIGASNYAVYIASTAVVMGHVWPIYYGFKGGKGMATSVGVNTYHDIFILLVQLVELFAINYIFRIMSVTSIIMAISSVIYIAIFKNNAALLIMSVINAIIVIFSHRENIKRLIQGKENKIERLGKKR